VFDDGAGTGRAKGVAELDGSSDSEFVSFKIDAFYQWSPGFILIILRAFAKIDIFDGKDCG